MEFQNSFEFRLCLCGGHSVDVPASEVNSVGIEEHHVVYIQLIIFIESAYWADLV